MYITCWIRGMLHVHVHVCNVYVQYDECVNIVDLNEL